MEMQLCCAVLGQPLSRFSWGLDEDATGCRALKLELVQQILALYQSGVTQFLVVYVPGVGQYVSELVDVLRESIPALRSLRITPYPSCVEQAGWSGRVSRELSDLRFGAYRQIVDLADVILAVYDQDAAGDSVEDAAITYAKASGRPMLTVHPDTGDVELSGL